MKFNKTKDSFGHTFLLSYTSDDYLCLKINATVRCFCKVFRILFASIAENHLVMIQHISCFLSYIDSNILSQYKNHIKKSMLCGVLLLQSCNTEKKQKFHHA